jgi:hypothetical protein
MSSSTSDMKRKLGLSTAQPQMQTTRRAPMPGQTYMEANTLASWVSTGGF